MNRYNEHLPLNMAWVMSDDPDAEWHVPNSDNITEIKPELRMPGEGCRRSDMTQSLLVAYDRAVIITQARRDEAEWHLAKLRAARSKWQKTRRLAL